MTPRRTQRRHLLPLPHTCLGRTSRHRPGQRDGTSHPVLRNTLPRALSPGRRHHLLLPWEASLSLQAGPPQMLPGHLPLAPIADGWSGLATSPTSRGRFLVRHVACCMQRHGLVPSAKHGCGSVITRACRLDHEGNNAPCAPHSVSSHEVALVETPPVGLLC